MTTNNDPSVILLPYLLSALENNGITLFSVSFFNVLLFTGCPSIVRSDYGTENTTLAACHMALRHEHDDEFSGEKSFWFGPSTTNTVELYHVVAVVSCMKDKGMHMLYQCLHIKWPHILCFC